MIPATPCAALLAALLALFPHPQFEPCLRSPARQAEIVADVTAAVAATNVPPDILLATGFVETHLTCAPGEGRGYGAPHSFRDRHVAGTATDAARILVRGLAVCGSWRGSLARFRSGDCHGDPVGDRYAEMVLRLVERMHRVVHAPTEQP